MWENRCRFDAQLRTRFLPFPSMSSLPGTTRRWLGPLLASVVAKPVWKLPVDGVIVCGTSLLESVGFLAMWNLARKASCLWSLQCDGDGALPKRVSLEQGES